MLGSVSILPAYFAFVAFEVSDIHFVTLAWTLVWTLVCIETYEEAPSFVSRSATPLPFNVSRKRYIDTERTRSHGFSLDTLEVAQLQARATLRLAVSFKPALPALILTLEMRCYI